MIKNLLHLLFSKLSCFLLFLVIPSFINAALVQIDPALDLPATLSKQTKIQFDTSSVKLKQRENYHPNDYSSDDSPLFRIPSDIQQGQKKPKLYDLKIQGKKILNDYQDNELISKSLNALSQAKQLWANADALATDFAYDIFFSLELDALIQSEISSTPALQNINSGFSTQQTQETPTHINQTSTVNYNLYGTKERGQVNKSTQEAGAINTLLSGLFHINTLYYLVATFILISFLQWLIPFLVRLFP